MRNNIELGVMKKSDWSFSAIVAGFVAVLVGFASSVAIVFQAAAAAGAAVTGFRWSRSNTEAGTFPGAA
jgi:predicted benzoate:H+ symporter BenE